MKTFLEFVLENQAQYNKNKLNNMKEVLGRLTHPKEKKSFEKKIAKFEKKISKT